MICNNQDQNIKNLMEQIVSVAEKNQYLRNQQTQQYQEQGKMDEETPRYQETYKELQTSQSGMRELKEKLLLSHKNVEELLKSLRMREKELEENKKGNNTAQIREDMERSRGEVQKLNKKLRKSDENSEELVEELRIKKRELEEKGKDIEKLRKEADRREAKNLLLEENLESLRDENSKLKNARRVESDITVSKINEELQDFKKEMARKMQAITNGNLSKEPDDKAPGKPKNTKKTRSTDTSIRNEKRIKSKPNHNDPKRCILQTDSEGESSETESEVDPNNEESIGRWKLGDGMWEQLPVKPGVKSYRGALETGLGKKKQTNIGDEKTLIISTSITRGIKGERFRNCYEGDCKFYRKHGAKASWIKDDVRDNLSPGECTSVILQMGGNDLQDVFKPDMVTKLANTIIETGHICKKKGIETVFIGGVPVRSYEYTYERCRQLNGGTEGLVQAL